MTSTRNGRFEKAKITFFSFGFKKMAKISYFLMINAEIDVESINPKFLFDTDPEF